MASAWPSRLFHSGDTLFTAAALPVEQRVRFLLEPAQFGDGLLDVVWVPIERSAAMLDWLDVPDSAAPPVIAARGQRIKIGSGSRTAVHVDDEFPDLEGNGPFDVEATIARI